MFDIKTLQKIRGMIISTLSLSSFQTPGHYKISTTSEKHASFILTLIQKQNFKLVDQIKSALEKVYGEKIRLSLEANGTVFIDVKKKYEEIFSIKEEAQQQPSLEGKDMYEKILTGVIHHLEESFYKGKKLSKTNITIGERKKVDDSIKLIFNEEKMEDFYPIIRDLEKHPLFKSRLSVYKNIIFIMQDEEVYEEKTEASNLINQLLSSLAGKVRDHNVTLTLMTPMTIAVTADPVKLQLRANTGEGAIRLYNNTDISWNPNLSGDTTLEIEIFISAIREYLSGNCTLRNAAKMAIGERTNEELSKVVPFGKTFEPSSIVSMPDTTEQKKGLQPRQIDTSLTGAPVFGYVSQSADYNEFHFLPFNRKVSQKHVKSIMASVQKNGVMGFVTVAITNVIDGVMRKYIVDGQHRYWAFRNLGIPILFTYTYAESKRQLVELIATLNNTSKSWSLKNYLNAWESVDSENYGSITKYMETTKLQITVLLEAFSGLSRKPATDRFMRGTFEIKDKALGEHHIHNILELRKYISKSRNLYSALLVMFRQISGYDNTVMVEQLLKKVDVFEVVSNEIQDQIVARLTDIYYGRGVAVA